MCAKQQAASSTNVTRAAPVATPSAPTPSAPDEQRLATTVAAIDVGSNSVRMVIAEVLDDGSIEVLERLQRAVRLGQDTFRRGRLGGQSMQATVAVLRDFRQLLRLYNVAQVRAVATSALREASNADTFVDRIFMATDIHLEVIGTSEESRLTVSAVQHAMGDALEVSEGRTLVVDVGGGITLLTVLEQGAIDTAQSLRLGSIRLQETLATSEEPPLRSADILRQQIRNELAPVQGSLPLKEITAFVAVGGDVRFASRQVGKPTSSPELSTIDIDDFDNLVALCERKSAEELSRRHGLPFADAETLTPALLVYQMLLHKTNARQMIVSNASLRDGLLLELACEVTGQKDETLEQGAIHSALSLLEKFHVDVSHARIVSELTVRLFDELQADHGLTPRHRLLLRIAALLHEIGSVVSPRAHHKHSYYLIANSEIFGLNRDEIELVALIARYHRRSPPKPSHAEYMTLSRPSRVLVNKMAAILRMADALARGHLTRVSDLQFERQGDDMTIFVPGGSNFLLEQRAIAVKGDLFEDIYGIKVHLEER